MADTLLDLFLWVVIFGFLTFCFIYAFLTKPPPWRDHIGRHMLSFMSGFAVSFIYALFSRYIEERWRTIGWVIVLILISVLVWSQVALLIKYQLEARKPINDR